METQTNITPPAQDNSSGANTVLLVIIIIVLAVFGYWWYRHSYKTAAPESNPSIDVNVKLPPANNNTGTSGGTNTGTSGGAYQ